MTFSLCATVDGRHGAAIATKAIGVGSTAPFVCRYGAVCTQAMTNTPIGVQTTHRLADGDSVDDAVAALLEADPDAPLRQVHGVDHTGTTVAKTGDACEEWAGDREGEGYTVAGNMLVGEGVLEAVVDAFEDNADRSLDERLLVALRAGEDAGGDKRRDHAQSAALSVFDPDEPRLEHDLRVDEHDDAVAELGRLHEVATTTGADWAERFPAVDLQRHPE
ncbi:DUF1028 domain-containing protein [Natronorubrum thiooxidans]|uniref:Uncharacterized conserved protein, Ntn-hydrolase superfamily n=1 Tax=Natronorubrum thiooxidans TaxID=308853 RepID=A0A1N7BZC2_9EURY|nr:DUF1028 domain-containing protein [Natronorubrum thiooxidans]SIR56544.1 Uncharacterized conserved protein, Ntn-hydrolase superfamily [Natronorubrum thiooxidans]